MIREEQDISDLSDNTFRMGGQWIPDGVTMDSGWGDNGFRMGGQYIPNGVTMDSGWAAPTSIPSKPKNTINIQDIDGIIIDLYSHKGIVYHSFHSPLPLERGWG